MKIDKKVNLSDMDIEGILANHRDALEINTRKPMLDCDYLKLEKIEEKIELEVRSLVDQAFDLGIKCNRVDEDERHQRK